MRNLLDRFLASPYAAPLVIVFGLGAAAAWWQNAAFAQSFGWPPVIWAAIWSTLFVLGAFLIIRAQHIRIARGKARERRLRAKLRDTRTRLETQVADAERERDRMRTDRDQMRSERDQAREDLRNVGATETQTPAPIQIIVESTPGAGRQVVPRRRQSASVPAVATAEDTPTPEQLPLPNGGQARSAGEASGAGSGSDPDSPSAERRESEGAS